MQPHTINFFRNPGPMDGALGAIIAALRGDTLAACASFADNVHAYARGNDQWRAAPHCMVVNLVRSGRKQP
jgi:hypothetical protein